VLFQGAGEILRPDEIGLSEAAWQLLGAVENEPVRISHLPPVESLGSVRSRMFGRRLKGASFDQIVQDVVSGRYSDVQLSAFITAGTAVPLDDDETFALTAAMANAGDRLTWDYDVIDKHSVGGLPGNRTTPLVVAIAAAAGLKIPKTSSRAITSPAGTADAMETVTNVALDLDAIRRVVDAEGGCLAWGGALRLSPADDIFIGVERQLDVDPEGQLIASVLSKKVAAGAKRVVLDIPVGPTAKVRSLKAGEALARRMVEMAARFDVVAECMLSDGSQPVGRSIGPALEMMDVLSVFRNDAARPDDLRDRAVVIAGAVLELGGAAARGDGANRANELLQDGSAYRKFENICRAQGGFREPQEAPLRKTMIAKGAGQVLSVDNRRIARLAKFAGAPDSPAAGLRMHVRIGESVQRGDPLFTLYAETQAELTYALNYSASVGDAITISAA
jgi:thymidine phosphorylase